MWLVLDTNQAGKFPGQLKSTGPAAGAKGIRLPPFVLAEILKRTNPEPTLSKLRAYDVELGIELFDIVEELSKLDREGILRYEPFARKGRASWDDYEDLKASLNASTALHREWARRCKDNNRAFCGELLEKSKEFKKEIKDSSSRSGEKPPKFASLQEALDVVGRGPESFLGSLICGSISNKGQRDVRLSDGDLFEAVMGNPFLHRFFVTILYYTIAFSNLWREQGHNFEAAESRDDWTDITVSLYASDGDLVLTADKKLKAAVAFINHDGRITSANCSEI
jgi:hypothetical protein